jgi:hypothetical protein
MNKIYSHIYVYLKVLQNALRLIPTNYLIKIMIVATAISLSVKYMFFTGATRNILILDDVLTIVLTYILINYKLPEPK